MSEPGTGKRQRIGGLRLGLSLLGAVFISSLGAQEPAPQVRLELATGMQCTAAIQNPALQRFMETNPMAAQIKIPPTAKKRTLAFSGSDASQETVYTDNSNTFEIFRGNFYLSLDSKSAVQIGEMGTETSPVVSDFRKIHFPELDWINETNNKGIQKINGVKYLVYEEPNNNPVLTKRLLADATTGYPLHLRTYDEIYDYSYSPKSVVAGQRIPLPQKLEEAWKKMKVDTYRYFKRKIEE